MRKCAIDFLGDALVQDKESLQDEILNRLIHLWESRLSWVESSSNKPQISAEIIGFGAWFVSGKFDNEWSLIQLLNVLRISNDISERRRVIIRLNELANEFPVQVVSSLKIIIESDSQKQFAYGY